MYTRAPFSHSWDVQNGVQIGSRIGVSKNLAFLMSEGPQIAPGCPKVPKRVSQEVPTEIQNLSKIDKNPSTLGRSSLRPFHGGRFTSPLPPSAGPLAGRIVKNTVKHVQIDSLLAPIRDSFGMFWDMFLVFYDEFENHISKTRMF